MARARSSSSVAPDKPFELVWSIVKRVPRGRVITYGMLEAERVVFDDAGLLDLARHAWSGGTKRTGAKRGRRSE